MKWSEEKVQQLHTLASAGKPNKEIAKALGVGINDVYAKRSQLGITIPKVKAMKSSAVNPDFEKALPTPINKERTGIPNRPTGEITRDLQMQFRSLSNAFEKFSALFVEISGSQIVIDK